MSVHSPRISALQSFRRMLLVTGSMAVALAAVLTAAMPAAQASELTVYECEPEGDVFYEVEVFWVDGNSTARIAPKSEYISAAESAAQTETAREQRVASGFSFDSRSYSFFGKGTDARLRFKQYPNDAPVPCAERAMEQTHASGAVGGNETMLGNAPARSLGGKLRNGPGTNFSAVGSLAEGAPVTVLANTGVRFDGYDWFEIRHGSGVAYQWGGIMCSDGGAIAGMFGDCASLLRSQAPAPVQTVASGGGWMAFAIGANGRFGHGAGASRQEAQSYAMQYCGDASCGIEDMTQAQCHALAGGNRNGHWFGAGNSKRAAESFAMGFCSNAEGSCAIRYSHCR
ncbi:DUF4189 domain-containing protein [Hoeflea alexandrii]